MSGREVGFKVKLECWIQPEILKRYLAVQRSNSKSSTASKKRRLFIHDIRTCLYTFYIKGFGVQSFTCFICLMMIQINTLHYLISLIYVREGIFPRKLSRDYQRIKYLFIDCTMHFSNSLPFCAFALQFWHSNVLFTLDLKPMNGLLLTKPVDGGLDNCTFHWVRLSCFVRLVTEVALNQAFGGQ